MIYAIIKSTGTFVDKPRVSRIDIPNEDDIAVKRKDEETKKVEQYTIAQLFDAHQKKSSYITTEIPEVSSDMFHSWFVKKFISGKNIENNLISIEYFRE